MNQQLIAQINGTDICAVRDESLNIFVPIKPICQALEVDWEGQRQRILRHYILGPTAFTLKVVAGDDKEREMLCLPIAFIYGWMFTIDANLVAESKREKVAQYQLECYEALYRHFAGSLQRRLQENEAEIAALKAVNDAILREKEAKSERRKAEEALAAIRKQRLDKTPTLFS